MNKTIELLQDILTNLDDRGYLKARENTRLEFKENFTFSSIASYIKIMSSFANTKGGIILYGIKDEPRIPVGIDRERFDSIRQERISTFLSEHFSPEIIWDIGLLEVANKFFGYIGVLEVEDKPVICKKTSSDAIKNGDVYYRYRGQSKTIDYPELKAIYDEVRQKERDLWMKHVERIGKVGPRNIAFIDLFDGKIQTGNYDGKIVMDSTLLNDIKKQVKFLEEGHFVEKDGAPALKIIGEIIQSNEVLIPDLDPNKDYPFLAKNLAEELSLRPYDVQVLIWKHKLKGNKKYNIGIETSKDSIVNKYSLYALHYLRDIKENMKDISENLTLLSSEYQKSVRENK